MGARESTHLLDHETSEQEFGDLVDRARHELDRQLLVELLPERSPVYRGRSANTVTRMRGYLLAAFEDAGLPEEAVPYVFEELESGRAAYSVAAAAKALRGRQSRSCRRGAVPADGDRRHQVRRRRGVVRQLPAELAAFRTHQRRCRRSSLPSPGSAVRRRPPCRRCEPCSRSVGCCRSRPAPRWKRSSQGFRPSGPCCAVPAPSPCCAGDGEPAPPVIHRIRLRSDVLAGVELEDQDGAHVKFREFFTAKPSVVAFFYTRCDNPNKCSLTITKLGRLQRRLAHLGLDGRIQTAAITYDPEFDLPARLRAYGENRGILFSPSNRLFRTTGALAPVEDYFQLGVNFGETLVNRHRIELFLLDQQARVAAAFTRLQWDIEQVLAQAATLAKPA